MKNYRTLSFCFLFFIVNTILFAQDAGYLNFTGKIVDEQSKPMKGATIKLLQDNVEASRLSTKKNGQFDFNIYFDGEYKIAFSYPGYVDMYLVIYASMAKGSIYPEYNAEISLHPYTEPGLDSLKFKEPFLKLIFDGKENFIPDEAYAAQFNAPKAVPEEKTTGAKAKASPSNFSKSNFPEKFVFADADKNNTISLVEVNSIVNDLKNNRISDKKELVNELIEWMLE